MQKIFLTKVDVVNIPDGYNRMNSMPDDPPNSAAFGKETKGSMNFLMVYPITADSAMPFQNPQAVIEGIHRALDKKQGLIEVKNGTVNGYQYIYSIVKTLKEPAGVVYTLTLHRTTNNGAISMQCFFDEAGTTGFRDSVVHELLVRDGVIDAGKSDDWCCDPYDIDYKNGCLMNRSEDEKYDAMFPMHPLTQARSFVCDVVNGLLNL